MVGEVLAPGIAVTRGEGPEGPLTRILSGRGARVLQWGSITFAPPEDPKPLRDALETISTFDWVYFSSPRAVDAVVDQRPSHPPGLKTVVVGPSTAGVLAEAGWPVDRLPPEPTGAGVVDSFRRAGDAPGARIFFPASEGAREEVPQGLTGLGAEVHRVTAYRMVTLPLNAPACAEALEAGEVQAVTFASPSAMQGLKAGLGSELFDLLVNEVPAAAMGPTTASALRDEGWQRVTVAEEPTLVGLADAALRAVVG